MSENTQSYSAKGEVSNITKKSGFFIFSHRVDLWQKQNFDKILSDWEECENE